MKYQNIFKEKSRFIKFFLLPLLIIQVLSCKKFVDVPAPITSVSSGNVYNTDATAIAVLTGLYQNILNNWNNGGDVAALSYYGGLSADEFDLLYNTAGSIDNQSYSNQLTSQSTDVFWGMLYNHIFVANSAIEGLSQSSSLTPAIKQQLLGEAKFCRALFYFYLVNLYGNVPLALTSDYKVNSLLARTGVVDDVYKQIIADLIDAQSKLSSNFLDASLLKTTGERVRPTKWAATALLARAYLYAGDYNNSVATATTLINNSTQFHLVSLSDAFKSNNSEAIWQLQANAQNSQNTKQAFFFIIPSTGPGSATPVSLSQSLLSAFEPNDQRKTNWLASINIGGDEVYYAYKYKNITPNTTTEYETVFRLAEQYLIRAEAEANLGNVNDAATDLNTIRTRANLPKTSAANKSTLISAIIHERQVEFFTEWGHRWLDLKRTGTVNAVMSTVTPQKGNTIWDQNQALYPIPLSDIKADPNLKQNPGY